MGFAKFWLFLYLTVPLERASKGPGPDLANLGAFCIKRPFTKSLEGPGPEILPILAISALSRPLQRASKAPGPDLARSGYFCIKRSL